MWPACTRALTCPRRLLSLCPTLCEGVLSQELHSSCSQVTGQDGFAGPWPPAQHFFPPDPVLATTVPPQAGAANPVDVEETHPGGLRKPPNVGGSRGFQVMREGEARLPLALRAMVLRSRSDLVMALPSCGGTGPAWGPHTPGWTREPQLQTSLMYGPETSRRTASGPTLGPVPPQLSPHETRWGQRWVTQTEGLTCLWVPLVPASCPGSRGLLPNCQSPETIAACPSRGLLPPPERSEQPGYTPLSAHGTRSMGSTWRPLTPCKPQGSVFFRMPLQDEFTRRKQGVTYTDSVHVITWAGVQDPEEPPPGSPCPPARRLTWEPAAKTELTVKAQCWGNSSLPHGFRTTGKDRVPQCGCRPGPSEWKWRSSAPWTIPRGTRGCHHDRRGAGSLGGGRASNAGPISNTELIGCHQLISHGCSPRAPAGCPPPAPLKAQGMSVALRGCPVRPDGGTAGRGPCSL